MLKSIKIHNIALISDCEIEFTGGLNVLSGETGAGKSVVLDSINFVLGQKADKSMILNGETECSATCVFDISDCNLAKRELGELGIEDEDTVIIRRTFSDSGRGSIRLNGEPVTATMLRKVTSALVDVHGQSDHFQLLSKAAQLELIDKLSNPKISQIKSEISEIIKSIDGVRADLGKLGGSDDERAKKLDYLSFAIDEIESASLVDGEEEKLIEKRKKLQNAEKIISALSGAHEALSGEAAAIDCVSAAIKQISSINSLSKEYEEISDNLENCMSVLQDVNGVLSDNLGEEFDFSEADETEKRIEFIALLKSKYGKTYSDIMTSLENMKVEYDLISKGSETAARLKKEEAKLLAELKTVYEKLTAERKSVAEKLSKELVARLKELAMKNARFSVEFESDFDENRLSANGIDKVEFMFSANAGEPLKPLSKVISGGELSRLMLALKSVTGGVENVGTYIFDEIDAGISGVTAQVVAENFARISRSRQIIAISHLPQIVAMSDASMFIKKTEDGEKTRTTVACLSSEDKIKELLRLIGGDFESVHAKEHAKDMLSRAENFKKTL